MELMKATIKARLLLAKHKTIPLPSLTLPLRQTGQRGAKRSMHDGTITCLGCETKRPVADYRSSLKGNGKRYLESRCNDCRKIACICRNLGITRQEYDRIYAASGGKCAICERTADQVKLCVDHCHGNGKLRGMLCAACNTGLGVFRDDTNLLRKAAEYVQESRFNHAADDRMLLLKQARSQRA
jgi:hypothetical protein